MARRFCAEHGCEIVEVYTDEEMTGRDTLHPGFLALRQSVEERSVDMVVVEALDRLTRRVADTLRSRELFKFQGVALHSIS